MAYSYDVTKLTNLKQLKKLAVRTKSEIDALDTRVGTLETAGYIPESSIDEKISAAVAGALQPAGSIAFASLPTLAKANCNKIYNITDAFTTTSDFVEGAGKSYPAGTNVAIINTGSSASPVYKYDTYTGTFDFSGFVTKKTSAVAGNFGYFDASGDLVDSGSKASDFLTQHQDISGKADKVANATSGNFAGLDANGNLVDSGSKASDFLTQHQDISGKADKPSYATADNLAAFDANKNPVDSGIAKGNVMQKVASATNGDFAKLNASGEVEDAGFGLATDTEVDDMIHDVWGDPEE